MVAIDALTRRPPVTGVLAGAGAGAVVAVTAAGGGWMLPVVVCTLAVTALALWSFEAFVLTMVVARPSLDALTPVGGGGAGSAASVLGWVFVCAAASWLLVQPRPGPVPASRLLAWGWLALAAVAACSALLSAQRGPALSEAARFAAVALMVPVANRLVTGIAELARILAALLAAAVLPVAVALHQAGTGEGSVFIDGILRARGTFLHPNSLGIFLVLAMVIGLAAALHLRGAARWAAVAVVGAATPALVATYARGAWVGAVLGAAVVLSIRARRALPALALGVGLVVLIAPSIGQRVAQAGEDRYLSGAAGNSLAWRFDYWRRIAPLTGERPLFGLGPGAVERSTAEAKPPHNDPLRVATELGAAGLVAYAAMVVGLARTARRALLAADDPVTSTVAVALAAAAAAFCLLSLVSNVISAVAVTWELAVLAGAAGAVPRLAGRNAVPDAVAAR